MEFGDSECCGRVGITHHFRVVVDAEDLWQERPALFWSDDVEPRQRPRDYARRWRELVAPYAISGARPPLRRGRLVLAELRLDEAPAIVREAARVSWFDWLDSIDSECAAIGGVVDRLLEEGSLSGESVLCTGSLLIPRRLGVHPLVRGEALGAKLLAHALWVLSRSTGDLAVLTALPARTRFEPKEPPRTAAAIQGLVRYYERLGFERSEPEQPIRKGTPVIMHRWVGGQGLPVLGLPGLTLVPQRRRP